MQAFPAFKQSGITPEIFSMDFEATMPSFARMLRKGNDLVKRGNSAATATTAAPAPPPPPVSGPPSQTPLLPTPSPPDADCPTAGEEPPTTGQQVKNAEASARFLAQMGEFTVERPMQSTPLPTLAPGGDPITPCTSTSALRPSRSSPPPAPQPRPSSPSP